MPGVGGYGIAGLEYRALAVGPTSYRPGVAGAGPPVLLLHGFPQTHYCWYRVAPGLTAANTVVVCDLKGYGESRSVPGGPLGEGYSNRERAAELVELMAELQFERMAGEASLDYYPWFLLAQPPPFSERLVAASAEYFLRHTLSSWAATPCAIGEEAVDRYARAFTPEAISGICADFRAAFHIDRPMDAEDRRVGRAIGCPVLVHWGAEEGSMSDAPLRVWRRWAADVRGAPLPSGHFVPEEAPEQLLGSLRAFLAGR